MSTFALTSHLLKHSALDQHFQAQDAHGSGASTPLFIPRPTDESGLLEDLVNDGAHTPVHFGNDFEKLFKNQVAALQTKLQELETQEKTMGKTFGNGGKCKEVLPPPGLLIGGPPGLNLPRQAPAAPVQVESKWQVSVGTVGHPFSCAAVCPYGGSNCPDRAKCQFCHECPKVPSYSMQMSVEPLSIVSTLQQQQEPANPLGNSVGSIGHPHSCGGACKYVKRKSGCRNGPQCLDCHLCHWQRTPLPKPQAPQKASLHDIIQQTMPPQQGPPGQLDWCSPCKVEIASGLTLLTGSAHGGQRSLGEEQDEAADASAEACPSVGSIGHPYTCGIPCKYTRKQKGCKDGKFCVCCHMCIWRRYQPPTGATLAAPLAQVAPQRL